MAVHTFDPAVGNLLQRMMASRHRDYLPCCAVMKHIQMESRMNVHGVLDVLLKEQCCQCGRKVLHRVSIFFS